MYQSKKELQRKFETLQRKCKTMVSGTPGIFSRLFVKTILSVSNINEKCEAREDN